MRNRVNAAAIYDLEVMRHDPEEWTHRAQARMDAAGIHGTEAQLIALARASQRSTIAGMLADLIKDRPTILREQQNIQNTRTGVFQHFAQNDPVAKLQQLQAAWDKMLVSLAGPAMDDAVRVLNATTTALNAVGAWASAHPTTARVLTDTAVGLGALATGLGALSTAIFLLGPALKLIGGIGAAGGGGSAAAAAAGVAARGGALGLASRMMLGGTAAGIGTALIVGSENETAANRARLDAIARGRRSDVMMGGPQDGFDLMGRPVAGAGAARSPVQVNLGTVQVQSDIHIDGTRIARVLSEHQAREFNGPPGGMTGYDPRQSPFSGPTIQR